MSILGLTRVRNEALIMQETLEHFSAFCSAGILVLDDASTDDTAVIASRHPRVVGVLRNEHWRTDRMNEEWRLRQVLLDHGRRLSPEWFLYFDADERLEWDGVIDPEADSIAMTLFDAYITEDDADRTGLEREWFGPEGREILMLFRNLPDMGYHLPDQRIVAGATRTVRSGFIKHFGKAISVEQWEETCAYYAEHFPEPYASKWRARMGRAVHRTSDFGRPLARWDDVKSSDLIDLAPSPHPLSDRQREAMRRAAESWYLCPRCQDLLAMRERGATFAMTCPRGC